MESTSALRERSLAPQSDPASLSAQSEAWDDAFLRVESYLHAHRIQGRVAIHHLAAALVEEAKRESAGQRGTPPVTAAMNVLYRKMAAWYSQAFGEGGASEDALRSRGRLALVMTHLEAGWPREFLDGRPVRPALAEALRESRLEAGPELRPASMPAAPLEFAVAPAGVEALRGLRRPGLIQAAGLWLAIIGAMGAAWASSH
ncbi:MAG TPA: hypothetical protein VHC86_11200 [Opitutaceae bacterium]|nr:hypothetical protein [Opitutaceae bacterium]